MTRRKLLSPGTIVSITLAICLILVVDGYRDGDVMKHFQEHRLGTDLSVFLLAMIALTNFRIFVLRRREVGTGLRGPATVWLMISVGFLFLALDDKFEIHESMDKALHHTLAMTETAMTDRIDDVIILLYGLIGMGVLFLYRAEIFRHGVLWRYLFAGFLVLVLQVALDILTNDASVFLFLGLSESASQHLRTWLGMLEEVVKLLAEALFLSGFIQVLHTIGTKTSQPRKP